MPRIQRILCVTFLVAIAACAANSAQAEVVRIPDAPFEIPPIVVPQFSERDFSIADFGAKIGVKATDAFAAAMAACEKAAFR